MPVAARLRTHRRRLDQCHLNLKGVSCARSTSSPPCCGTGDGASVNTSSTAAWPAWRATASTCGQQVSLTGLLGSGRPEYARRNIWRTEPGPDAFGDLHTWMPTDEARAGMAAGMPMNDIAHQDDMARAALYLLSEGGPLTPARSCQRGSPTDTSTPPAGEGRHAATPGVRGPEKPGSATSAATIGRVRWTKRGRARPEPAQEAHHRPRAAGAGVPWDHVSAGGEAAIQPRLRHSCSRDGSTPWSQVQETLTPHAAQPRSPLRSPKARTTAQPLPSPRPSASSTPRLRATGPTPRQQGAAPAPQGQLPGLRPRRPRSPGAHRRPPSQRSGGRPGWMGRCTSRSPRTKREGQRPERG
jgi:hypothetical protein